MILDAYESPTRRLSYVVPFISNFEVFYVKIYRTLQSFHTDDWSTGSETAPSAVCLAGSSPEEVEATLPHLQGRTDWVVLTPPLSDDSPALAFLALHGRQILTGSGSSFRTRGWWKTGSDELAKYSTNLDCWIAREAKPERDKIEALGRTLCQNLSNEPPFLNTTKLGLIFRAGTEAGLLGLHDHRLAVYATDGSLEDNVMGAGVYVAHSRKALSAKIGRSSEGRTSLRVETIARMGSGPSIKP